MCWYDLAASENVGCYSGELKTMGEFEQTSMGFMLEKDCRTWRGGNRTRGHQDRGGRPVRAPRFPQDSCTVGAGRWSLRVELKGFAFRQQVG